MALERYEEALPLYERVSAHEREGKIARGRPGRRGDILHLLVSGRQEESDLPHARIGRWYPLIVDPYGDAAGV